MIFFKRKRKLKSNIGEGDLTKNLDFFVSFSRLILKDLLDFSKLLKDHFPYDYQSFRGKEEEFYILQELMFAELYLYDNISSKVFKYSSGEYKDIIVSVAVKAMAEFISHISKEKKEWKAATKETSDIVGFAEYLEAAAGKGQLTKWFTDNYKQRKRLYSKYQGGKLYNKLAEEITNLGRLQKSKLYDFRLKVSLWLITFEEDVLSNINSRVGKRKRFNINEL